MSRLLPRYRADDDFRRRVARAIAGAEERPPVHPRIAGGDHLRLRGIPVLAYGVGGAALGSRPEREIMKLDKRLGE